jgi:predicted CoA-binding protein
MASKSHQVAVLGASRKSERYSNRAVRALKQHGYRVVPVNPAHDEVEGLTAASSVAEIAGTVDTLTVYVGPRHIGPLIDDIVAARPRRVILNTGTESAELAGALDRHGIPWLEACTLVLLATGQFESALAPVAGAAE